MTILNPPSPNKGWFLTSAELISTYPTGKPGWFALIGETNTVWAWDTTLNMWKDTAVQGTVNSFNSRTGDVLPQSGDYNAAQVGLDNVDNVKQIPFSYLDSDVNLSADSNDAVATQHAGKAYSDTKIAIADIVDNTSSVDTNKPLSANQGKVINDSLTSHVNNTSNPHSVTKTQVGLSNVDDLKQIPYSYLDTDNTLSAHSDQAVATQKAGKDYSDTKLAKTTNVTSINDTGIADGEIAVFNLTNKDIRTSDKTIVTTLGITDDTIPTSKAIRDNYEKDFVKAFLFMGA